MITCQLLVGSQVHRSLRREGAVRTPVPSSWLPLPVSVGASPSDIRLQRLPAESSAVSDFKRGAAAEAGERRRPLCEVPGSGRQRFSDSDVNVKVARIERRPSSALFS